jgi:hypothetical protein
MANTTRKPHGADEVSFDYRLENDPRFQSRIEKARASVRMGRGVPLEDVESK